jgi:hypothetical protein
VSTELLSNNGCLTANVCEHSCYLAMGLHVSSFLRQMSQPQFGIHLFLLQYQLLIYRCFLRIDSGYIIVTFNGFPHSFQECTAIVDKFGLDHFLPNTFQFTSRPTILCDIV